MFVLEIFLGGITLLWGCVNIVLLRFNDTFEFVTFLLKGGGGTWNCGGFDAIDAILIAECPIDSSSVAPLIQRVANVSHNWLVRLDLKRCILDVILKITVIEDETKGKRRSWFWIFKFVYVLFTFSYSTNTILLLGIMVIQDGFLKRKKVKEKRYASIFTSCFEEFYCQNWTFKSFSRSL